LKTLAQRRARQQAVTLVNQPLADARGAVTRGRWHSAARVSKQ